jgi:hypothetical protein
MAVHVMSAGFGLLVTSACSDFESYKDAEGSRFDSTAECMIVPIAEFCCFWILHVLSKGYMTMHAG